MTIGLCAIARRPQTRRNSGKPDSSVNDDLGTRGNIVVVLWRRFACIFCPRCGCGSAIFLVTNEQGRTVGCHTTTRSGRKCVRILREPSAPHDGLRSGRYRTFTVVITVAGAAPDSNVSHRTSLLTCPDQKADRHLTWRTLLLWVAGVNRSR